MKHADNAVPVFISWRRSWSISETVLDEKKSRELSIELINSHDLYRHSLVERGSIIQDTTYIEFP